MRSQTNVRSVVPINSSLTRAACCTPLLHLKRRCGSRFAVALSASHSSGKCHSATAISLLRAVDGLVVEVDGGVHRVSQAADRRRDEKLHRLGYRVMRVDAALVLRNPKRALDLIRAALR